jgi:hypothetical protein
MLARSYYFLKNYQAASETFARAVSMTQQSDPNLLADYADALAMAQGRNMQGQPYEMVKRALEIQPFHEKSLWLAGTAAYQAKDYSAALQYWQNLAQLFPEGSDSHNQMLRNIAEVQQLMGQDVDPQIVAKLQAQQQGQQQTQQQGGQTGAGGASISGEVTLDPTLRARVSAGDTVFIFARAANGPRMPLAILKHQANELPIRFTLDDSSAMNPSMKLSNFQDVVVSARISKTGNAMPQPGDLEGTTEVIKVGTQGLKLVINGKVGESKPQPVAATSTAQSASAASANVRVSGQIRLDPDLQGKVSPEDTVFVFARAAEGPRMPLAIVRKQVKDLPLDFSLDDTDAMNPAMKMSNFEEVIVGARISKTGDAIPKSGDLKGTSSVVKVGSENLKIIIDSAVP